MILITQCLSLEHSYAAKANGLPEVCFKTSLESTFPSIAVGEKSNYFVKCKNDKSEPMRGQKRPLYKKNEIKQLQVAFSNITDCFDIEAKWLFPKLMMESGFHPGIQNPNGDAGIGQLTWAAIRDVDSSLPRYKEWLNENKKPSCKWVAKTIKSKKNFWSPLEGQSKCAILGADKGAFKNLFYTAVFHRMNKDYVNKEFEKRKISQLLSDAGFPDGHNEKIKKLLFALGYNTGGKTAVKNLEEYLLSRIDQIKKQKNIEQGLFYSLLNKETQPVKNELVTLEDFNFTKDLSKVKNRNLAANEIVSFPNWLKVWQTHGGPGYLTSLATYSVGLEKKLGKKVCSDSNFYRIEL